MMSSGAGKAYLEGLGIDAMKKAAPSLERIRALCSALNDPQDAVQALHITGTNGKTSTARIASSLLSASGLSVGTYTSPHLETLYERIALNGDPISEEDFESLFEHLLPYLHLVEERLDERLTFFEVLTAMFFLWAAESSVDVAVIEVGLGGRWDATNVVQAPVAVITNVGLDHTGLLGSAKEQIAAEKAGIIKPDSAVVSGELAPGPASIIAAEARELGSSLSVIGRDFEILDNRLAFGGRYLSVRTSRREYEGLFLPLHGSHQGVNAAVALESDVRFLPAQELSHELILEGLGGTSVPGRLESLNPLGEGGPKVVLDVAHNPDGMSALVASLSEAFAFERAVVVLAILADKDWMGMLRELSRLPCSIVATRPKTVRSIEPAEMCDAASELGIDCVVVDEVSGAVKSALESASASEVVCITGSHYLVGEARPLVVRDQ